MKKKIKWLEYTDTISERTYKFKCKYCRKDICGKKVKYDFRHTSYPMCLKCLVEKYEEIVRVKVNHLPTHILKKILKALKEIKRDYAVELVALEL